MYYKTASIMLNTGQKASTTSEIFIAQPDANKEILAGKLFILIEIEFNKKVEALKIINFLINNLNYNYYQSEKIILRERISTLKVEHIFETTLAKTNRDLAEFLSREKIKINPSAFNITTGIIYENNIHFSIIGKNKALLIYKQEKEKKDSNRQTRNFGKSELEIKYKIADISQNIKEESSSASQNRKQSRQINLTKLFSNVISGSIPTSGYFLFTNETLPEYLSSKQLIAIITKLPPAGAMAQMKNILARVNTYVSFLGIIIKNTTGQKQIISSQEKINIPIPAQGSIIDLNYTEEETEKLLTPSGIINFKKWFKASSKALAKIPLLLRGEKFKGGQSDLASRAERVNKKIFLIKDKIFFKEKPSFLSFKKIIGLIKNIIIYLINLVVYLFKICTSREQLMKFLHRLKLLGKDLKRKIKESWNWFKNLNRKNKILFTVATACLILLLINLSYISLKNKKQEKQQILSDLAKTIEQKQNQIDANLLYSNEAGAKEILNELKEFLDKLPRETEEQIEQYKKFIQKHNQQLEKIQHVVKIETVEELANFNNLNSRAKTTNILFLSDRRQETGVSKIYSGDSEQKTIYILDLTNNLVTAITDLSQPIEKLIHPVVDKDKNIYYLNNLSAQSGSVIKLDNETEEISNLSINLPTGLKNIIAATSFNNRLYLLDNQNSQIYRLSKTADGFTKRDNWIKEKTDLTKAVDISIDGYVYILKNDGQVLKYLKGREENFALESIEPPFQNATKIIVSPELEYIYILEPTNKRLAIFNKTGKFLIQYQSDKFTDLKDFAVDEKNKKIYFLNNTSVYIVEGVHFEE